MSTANDASIQVPPSGPESKVSSHQPTSSPCGYEGSGKQSRPLGSNAMMESIRGIYNSTAAPQVLTNATEFANVGLSFNAPSFLKGHYTAFFRALASQEHILMKTLDLGKMTPAQRNHTIDESCKILEYIGKREHVPNVVRIYGQYFLGDTLHVFMREYKDRSIHYKMRFVTRFKENLVRQWCRELGAVCKYMQEKGIVHRSIRVEHLLLDEHESLNLTGFTRAIFLLNPHNFKLNKCNRENPIRKKNHLPPECFTGSKHSPEHIDCWSYGVAIVSLFSNRHPFKPKGQASGSQSALPEQQWQAFVAKHGAMINTSVVLFLNRLFILSECERPSLDELLKLEYFSTDHKKDGKKKSPRKVSAKAPVLGATNGELSGHPSTPTSDDEKSKSKKQSQVPKFEAVPIKAKSRKSSKSKPSTAGSSKSSKRNTKPLTGSSANHSSAKQGTTEVPQSKNTTQVSQADHKSVPPSDNEQKCRDSDSEKKEGKTKTDNSASNCEPPGDNSDTQGKQTETKGAPPSTVKESTIREGDQEQVKSDNMKQAEKD